MTGPELQRVFDLESAALAQMHADIAAHHAANPLNTSPLMAAFLPLLGALMAFCMVMA